MTNIPQNENKIRQRLKEGYRGLVQGLLLETTIYLLAYAVSHRWWLALALVAISLLLIGAVLFCFPRLSEWLRKAPVSRVVWVILIVTLVLALAVSAVLIYNANVKTTYYTRIVERYGLPYGVGERLTTSDRADMSDYWMLHENRFINQITATYITTNGPLDLLKANSTLYSLEILPQPASIVYTYLGSDNTPIVSRVLYRKGERTLLELNYQAGENGEPAETIAVTSYDGSAGEKLLHSYFFRVPSSAYRALLPNATLSVRYDQSGLPIERTLVGQADAYSAMSGVFGERYTYDEAGQLTQLTFLDENGTPRPLGTGATAVRFSYTHEQRLDEIRYFADEDCREPTKNRGAYVDVYEYDASGYNLVGRSFRDRDGLAAPDRYGVYTYRYEYEGQSLVKESYLGKSGNPIFVSQYKGDHKAYTYQDDERVFCVTTTWDTVQMGNQAHTPADISFEDVYAAAIRGDADTADTTQGSETGGEQALSESRIFTTVYALDEQGRVTRESYTNGTGQPVVNVSGYASIVYQYDKETGGTSSVAYLDSEGAPFIKDGYSSVAYEYENGELACETYMLDGRAAINFSTGYAMRKTVYNRGLHSVVEQYLDDDEHPVFSTDGYQEWLRLYDQSGRLEYEYYCEAGANGKLVLNRDGYAGIKYAYEQGREIRREYLNRDRQPTINYSTGYAVLTTEYVAQTGKVERVRYFDTDGSTPLLDKDNAVSGYLNEYDGGNLVKVTYYGLDGRPALRKDEGYAVREMTYDADNNEEWTFYYAADGVTPVPQSTTWASARHTEYDAVNGQVSDYYYYGPREEGQPVRNKTNPGAWQPILNKDEGAAHIHYERDKRGNLTEVSYYGLNDGTLTLIKGGGYAVRVQHFDEWDRFLGSDYLDVNRAKILHKTEGYASDVRILDDAGRLLEISYYGVNGERVLATDDKVAGNVYTYYTEGKLAGLMQSRRYFGVDGPDDTVLNDRDWAAGFEREYDEFGRIYRTSIFGKLGKPVARRYSGHTTWEYQYDTRGNHVITNFRDATGALITLANTGYATIRKTYYDDFTVESEVYLAPDEEKQERVINTQTWRSGMKWNYDRFGREVSCEYLDEMNEPTLDKDTGIAKYEITYHTDGREASRRYRDTERELAPRKTGGYAIVTYDFVERTRVTSYWIDEGVPCVNLDKWYASVETEYDARGLAIKSTYFGTDGKPAADDTYGYSQVITTHDEWGNAKTQIYLDVDESGAFVPVPRKDRGYAYVIQRYDDYGRHAGSEFFEPDRTTRVIDTNTGSAYFTQERNMAGNMLEERRYGVNGPLVAGKGGYAIERWTYDDVQRTTSTAYFDENDQPIIGPYGYASYTASFDGGRDLVSEYVYRGTDGKPMLVRREGYGYAVVRQEFDDRGLITSWAYYDDAEPPRPILGYDRYARLVKRYDALGNKVEEALYDTQGNKTINKSGYARMEWEYEGGARQVTYRVYDDHDTLLPRLSNGYATRDKFDEFGRTVGVEYLDQYGERTDNGSDYAYIRHEFTPLGDEETVRYFKKDGTPAVRYNNDSVTERYSYDTLGREVLRTFLDADNQPVTGPTRHTYTETRYDARGLVAWREYRDADKKPLVPTGWGQYAPVTYTYDGTGRTRLVEYSGADGAPLLQFNGYAKIKIEYDRFARRQTITFLNAEGEPTALRFTDADGKSYNGYASIVIDLDARGNERRVAYLDARGKPVAFRHGKVRPTIDTADFRGVFLPREDDGDNLIEKPYAIVETEYDARDRVIKRAYFTADGIPIDADVCAISRRYDDVTNQLAYEWFLNADCREVDHGKLGYSRHDSYWEREDQDGVILFHHNIAYFNAAGKRVVNSEAFHLEWTRYDERGQITATSFWVLDDEGEYHLVLNQALGYGRVSYERDAFGRETLTEYWDEQGTAALATESGVAAIEREYDVWGHIVSERYFGMYGESVVHATNGYATIVREYNEYGVWQRERKYDADGKEL